MGVLGLWSYWLKRKYRHTLKTVPETVSTFSFDLNAVIHEVKAKVIPEPSKRNATITSEIIEQQIINGVKEEIASVAAMYGTQTTLIVAVDGVAPIAKQNQQNFRRSKTGVKSPEELVPFDPNCISPGTEFMFNLDLELQNFFRNHGGTLPPKIIYSSHLVPGEGEHKIMDYLRGGTLGPGPHMIYGMDADLVLLSLVSPARGIILTRNREAEGLYVDDLRQSLAESLGKPEAVDDFVLLASLVGNDFLPIIPIFSAVETSLEYLIQIYKIFAQNYPTTLIVDGKVDVPALFTFMSYLNAYSEQLLNENREHQKQLRYKSSILVDEGNLNEKGTLDVDKFRLAWNMRFFQPRALDVSTAIENVVNQNADTEYHVGTTLDDVTKMANDYVRTLVWVYNYYKHGTKVINLEWAYTYYFAPHPAEITYVLEQMVSAGAEIKGYLAFPGMIRFTPMHQMLAILPKASVKLLPEKLQPLMTSIQSPLFYRYVSDFQLLRENTDADHHVICLLPFIDAQEIYAAVAQVTWTTRELERYLAIEDIVYGAGLVPRSSPSRGGYRGRGSRGGGRGSRGGGRGSRGGRGGGRGGSPSAGTSGVALPPPPPAGVNIFGLAATSHGIPIKAKK